MFNSDPSKNRRSIKNIIVMSTIHENYTFVNSLSRVRTKTTVSVHFKHSTAMKFGSNVNRIPNS